MKFSTASVLALATGINAAKMSICDKYTTALLKNNTAANQEAVVALIVKTSALGNYTGNGTANPTLPGSLIDVPGFLAPGTVGGVKVNLLPYFTGALASTNVEGMPGAVDWLDSGTPAELTSSANATSAGAMGTHGYVLISHLISYFGVLLGCSGVGQTGYPAYAGSNDMAAVHQYMDLSEAEFTWFVENVGLAAESFGVSKADATTVGMALNSTFGYACSPPAVVVPGTPAEPQAICQGMGCPMASNAVCGDYISETMPASATASMISGASISAYTVATMTGSMASTMTGSMASTMTMASGASMMSSAQSTTSMPVATGAAVPLGKIAGYVLAAGPVAAAFL